MNDLADHFPFKALMAAMLTLLNVEPILVLFIFLLFTLQWLASIIGIVGGNPFTHKEATKLLVQQSLYIIMLTCLVALSNSAKYIQVPFFDANLAVVFDYLGTWGIAFVALTVIKSLVTTAFPKGVSDKGKLGKLLSDIPLINWLFESQEKEVVVDPAFTKIIDTLAKSETVGNVELGDLSEAIKKVNGDNEDKVE